MNLEERLFNNQGMKLLHWRVQEQLTDQGVTYANPVNYNKNGYCIEAGSCE